MWSVDDEAALLKRLARKIEFMSVEELGSFFANCYRVYKLRPERQRDS